ncbi:MAG: SpoIIE family protein phosphatase [Silvibacterium sp.]
MKKIGLLLLVLLPIPTSAFSQTTLATASAPIANTSISTLPPAQVVALGDSAATLAGPWRFAPGDSPWVNGAPVWASPAFDDAGWADMGLHSGSGEVDPSYGSGGYLTGWTARGFSDLWGFAWYRLRVHVASSTGPLWIKMPDHVDDSYQVFANGQYVGEFGRFLASGVKSYRSRPLVFELPAPDEHGDILLAIRFYAEPSSVVMSNSGDGGGMHEAPVLGIRPQIELLLAQANTLRVMGQVVPVFVGFLMLVAAAVAFRIWLLDRPHTTYLWLTLGFLLEAAPIAAVITALFTYVYTQATPIFLQTSFSALGAVCWILFWRQWFEIGRKRVFDLLRTAAAAVVILATCTIFWHRASLAVNLLADRIGVMANIVLGVMLFMTLAQGARKDRMGALVALPPVILVAISLLEAELISWFHIRTSFFPFGVAVGIGDIAGLLLVLVVGALTARRFLHSQVKQRLEQQAVKQELEQARELQQHVLIPEPVNSPVFTVETEYHPAQTVGGDFFQTLTKADGSLLVVIGDVSGKGVSAAMLVAVLVGAIRNQAESSFDPAAMLGTLNRRLLGRSGGHFATCIVAEIRPDGTMRIANAGHLPPYLNGKEMEMEGSLPLGLSSEAEYPVQAFRLVPEDRLTFLTDGVVEATNATKELFGFERTREISRQRATAIVEQAQSFGQEDDITVLGVAFAAVASPVQAN